MTPRSRSSCPPTPERPKAAVDGGFAVPDSRFTYAIGKLVLWSKVVDVTKGDEALKAGDFAKLAIANPAAAPYGAAAIEAMKALGVYDALQPKIVQGNSIAQTFQFVDTRNAEVGFVALSQLFGVTDGNALAGSARSLCADPAGRRAPQEGRERRGVDGLPRIPEGPGSARHHREHSATGSTERTVLGLPARHLGPDPSDDRTRDDHDARRCW